MSIYYHLFVGPYAAWYVPKRRGREAFRDTPLCKNLLEKGVLHWQRYLGDLPEVKRGRTIYHRYTFMPRQPRANRPGREMYFVGQGGNGPDLLDLSEVDRQAEISWFAEAFRDELQALAEYFGEPATLRWGIASWLS